MARSLYLILVVLISASSHAGVLNVPADYGTIQGGIDAALAGDTVLVADGVYRGTGNTDMDLGGKPIVVRSANGPESVTIDCERAGRAFYVQSGEDSNSVISGFRIINGWAERGGAVRVANASPTVRDCIFEGNFAISAGGAVHASYTDDLRLINCDFFADSTHGYGGGLCTQFGTVTLLVDSCTFAENSSERGGAAAFGEGGSISLVNCTIANNRAMADQGGGIWQAIGSLTLENTIIAFQLEGGAAKVESASATCCDIFGNFVSNWSGPLAGQLGSNGNISLDPMFADIQSRDFNLACSSPCRMYNNECGVTIGAKADDCRLPLPYNINLGDEDSAAVVDHTPTFYWSVHDTLGSATAFEIEAGTDGDWALAELWQSGEVISTDTSFEYAGSELQDNESYFARIRLQNSEEWGDWDFFTFTMNGEPSSPGIIWPASGDTVSSVAVYLTALNSTDPQSSSLTYDFEIHRDESLTDLADEDLNVPEGASETSSGLFESLVQDTVYWWRVRAYDGYEYSAWSQTADFYVRGATTIRVPENLPTIRAAVDAAYEGDTILVAPGTYTGPDNRNIDFGGKNLVLVSESGPELTVIDCQDSGRGFIFDDGESPQSRVEGFTIRDGKGSSGGGIYVNGANPTIVGCVVFSSHASNGGGMYVRNVTEMTITDCQFLGNETMGYGAGLCCQIGSLRLDIEGCVFSGNTAGYGGAIAFGGNSDVSVTGCTFVDNSAGNGEAVWQAGDVIQVSIQNSILAYNGLGDVLYCNGSLKSDLICCDVYGNGGGDWTGCLQELADFDGNFSLEPRFADFAGGDYRVECSSPCMPHNSGCDAMVGALAAECTPPVAVRLDVVNEDVNHVLDDSPEFSWSQGNAGDPPATAYELEVGSDADWSTAEMWATGEVISSNTSAVYKGAPLEDGTACYLRLRLRYGSTWGSWSGMIFRTNAIPGTPTAAWPVDGGLVLVPRANLVVHNAVDIDGDHLYYDYEVYADPTLATLVGWDYSVAEQPGTTGSRVITGLVSRQTYWWVSRAYDGYEYSPWGDAATFFLVPPEVVRVPQDQPTIQAGIDAARDGDTVLVASGVYTGSGNKHLEYKGKQIVVASENGPELTIVDCEEDGRGFYFRDNEDTSCVLIGFTVRNGSMGPEHGGALRVQNSAPKIVNCILESNRADNGGAVYLNTVPGMVFEGCKFVGNSAKGGGGAVFAQYGYPSAVFRRCLFSYNTAQGGAAVIADDNSRLAWENCTFAYNSATSGGGIIQAEPGCDLTLNRSVMAFNQPGYAVLCQNPINVDVECCNIYGNGSGDWEYCLAGFDEVPGNISADPLFVDSEENNFNVKCSSPCLWFSNPCGVSIGAFERGCNLPSASDIVIGEEGNEHVIESNPLIRWVYFDTLSTQTAYELELGFDSDWSLAECWATGEVPSDDTAIVYQGVRLTDGQVFQLRLRVSNGFEWGEWNEISLRTNTPPPVPVAQWPVDEQPVSTTGFGLTADCQIDAEEDELTCDFAICSDSQCIGVLTRFDDIPVVGGLASTEILLGYDVGDVMWWHCRTFDGYEHSSWSEPAKITVLGPRTLCVPEEFSTIQAAIDIASSRDTVLVAEGTFHENIDFVGKEIVVTSVFGADQTTICALVDSIPTVSIANGEKKGTEISGFTITGSRAGGVHCNKSSPLIRNNVITGNRSSLPNRGAAVDWVGVSGAVLTHNVIHGDTAVINGAPVHLNGGCVEDTISYNIFYDNLGNGQIRCTYEIGLICVTNNTIEAGGGEGLRNDARGDMFAYNNIIYGADSYGMLSNVGSIWADYNCTWDNNLGDYNFTPMGNNISADPQFLNQEQRDYRLAATSPCVDAGHPSFEYSDPDGSRNDIGALYYAPVESYSPAVCLAPLGNESQVEYDLTPTFSWTSEASIGPTSGLSYWLVLSMRSDFQLAVSVGPLIVTDYTWTDSLPFGSQFWWKVDICGNDSVCVPPEGTPSFFTWCLGDVNESHNTDIEDVQRLVDYFFLSMTPIMPSEVGDVNGDCRIDIGDLQRLIDHLFLSLFPLEIGCEGGATAAAAKGHIHPAAPPETVPGVALNLHSGSGAFLIQNPEEEAADSLSESERRFLESAPEGAEIIYPRSRIDVEQ